MTPTLAKSHSFHSSATDNSVVRQSTLPRPASSVRQTTGSQTGSQQRMARQSGFSPEMVRMQSSEDTSSVISQNDIQKVISFFTFGWIHI